MKSDAPISSFSSGFLYPLRNTDKKTVLWIALLAIFVWILVSDLVNGGKSFLLHLSLARQTILGQTDAEIAGKIVRISRENRKILDGIGRLSGNRRRFEEHAGMIGSTFGRKLTLKKAAIVPVPGIPDFGRQDLTLRYTAGTIGILSELPEWKALSALPGVTLRSLRVAPGDTPDKEEATIAFRLFGTTDKPPAQKQGRK